MNFRKFLAATAVAFVMPFVANAQEAEQAPQEEGWIFTEETVLPITSMKDQNAAGTCWCYSTLSFVEAELLRMGKPEYDFSEMFIVWNTYMDRAKATVRTHGDISFSQGGSFYDVLYGIKHYGLVPDAELPAGVKHGDELSDFSEFSSVCDPFVEGIVKNKKLQVSPEGTPLWQEALAGILDAYIGERPETFVYEGKEYTPKSFAESTGFNPDDYVNLTSFSHHPFYEDFIIEVQDNWRWSTAYNLPIDEFMEVMNYAIDNGYPIAWGSDVSERGFLRGDKLGIVVLPDLEAKDNNDAGTDKSRWVGLSAEERAKEAYSQPTPQRWVTQEERQVAYDNYETGDDHGMIIYGKAKDQLGNNYFIVKNSWGEIGKYDGKFYASEAFVRYKTMNIVVHKDALPKKIKKALGIK
ncbi:MAG: aminopeptidase [Bacteroidales bacterium]|nr:aminopeptidase [Bacteroidales bacterium]